jgi:hypothetical protein
VILKRVPEGGSGLRLGSGGSGVGGGVWVVRGQGDGGLQQVGGSGVGSPPRENRPLVSLRQKRPSRARDSTLKPEAGYQNIF